MKKYIYCIAIIILVLVAGCDKELTFEESFHQQMENKKDTDYTLIHYEVNVIDENDAIAVFVENRIEKDVIFIAHFEKEESEWKWKKTRGNTWEDNINWTLTEEPYIYSGAISDEKISGILLKNSKATIIDVDGNKRFWYSIAENNNQVVKYIYQDGTEEIIEEY